MVIYDLVCDNGHAFEGWFKGPDDWQNQLDTNLLNCPMCGSLAVSRKLSAAKVTRKSNSGSAPVESVASRNQLISADPQAPEKFAQFQQMLNKVHEFVEQNFEDVGNQFSDKAISMHKGELEQANIRGVATREQVAEMAEQGVDAVPLPPKPVDPKKLN